VHGQSEVGTLQPIGDAARLATELRVPLFVDAAQTLGRVPLAPIFETADAVSLSPHKAGGLRGMGVLVVCSSLGVRPLLLGGGQERGLRPGTMSPALAAATSLAIELAIAEQAERAARMAAARVAFLAGLAEASVDLMRIGDESSCLPNTLMLQFAHLDGRHLLPALDLEGVEASQGSACSSGSPTPPHVLSAMGLDEASARACVRFSFGARHDEAAAFVAGTIAGRVVARLQKKKPVVR
jgi:cysteine desulfurase